MEQVRLLLSHDVDVDCQTASGYTPLLIATQDQQPDLCALLLAHGADTNLADEDGWAPLHFAAQNGDDHTARLLLDHGALVNAREHEGWTHSTWLHRTTLRMWHGFWSPVRLTSAHTRLKARLPFMLQPTLVTLAWSSFCQDREQSWMLSRET